MLQRLLLCAALVLTTNLAKAQEIPMGRVFNKDINRREFTASLALIRSQLDPRFSPRQLWSRFSFINEAKRSGLTVKKEELLRRVAKLCRDHLIDHDAKKALEGPLSLAKNKPLYKKHVLALQKSFVFNDESYTRFLKIRKIDGPSLKKLLYENTLIDKLFTHSSKDWDIQKETQKRLQNKLGSVQLKVLEFKADDRFSKTLTLSPSVEQLKLFHQQHRVRFRQKRQLKLAYVIRKDDGQLRQLAEFRQRWLASRKTKTLEQMIEGTTFQSHGVTKLKDWNSLSLPESLRSPIIQDIANKSSIGNISMPLRVNGIQALIAVIATRPARTLSYEQAGGADPKGLLHKLWIRSQSLSVLLDEAHRCRRLIESHGWSACKDKPGHRSFDLNITAGKETADVPKQLPARALQLETGESALVSDIEQQRILLIRAINRSRPKLSDITVSKREAKKTHHELTQQWRTQLLLRSKNVTPAIQDYVRQLMAPKQRLVIRQLVLDEKTPDKERQSIQDNFSKGVSLSTLASRSKAPQQINIYQSSLITGAAEQNPSGHIEGPIIIGDEWHLILTKDFPIPGHKKTMESLVFHIALSAKGQKPEVMEQRIALLAKKLSAHSSIERRLAEFRRTAKALSCAPTKALGGFLGYIQHEVDPVVRATKKQIALLDPGQRCTFLFGKNRVFVAILDSFPVRQYTQKKFDDLFERALPWNDFLEY